MGNTLEFVENFISNQILKSGLFSWFFAQFLKIIIEILKKNKFKTGDFILRAFFGTGGMPSSHTATVTAVATSIGITEGFQSPIFALAFIFVLIVIRDSTGVRLSSGKQAIALNKLLDIVSERERIELKKIKEVKGHTPLECFVGMLIGLIVSLGFFIL